MGNCDLYKTPGVPASEPMHFVLTDTQCLHELLLLASARDSRTRRGSRETSADAIARPVVPGGILPVPAVGKRTMTDKTAALPVAVGSRAIGVGLFLEGINGSLAFASSSFS